MILKAAVCFLSLFVFSVIILSGLDHWNCFGSGNILCGVSYFPPIWLLPLVFVLIVLLLILKKRSFSVITVVVYIIYFTLWGDYSFNFLANDRESKNKNTPITVLSLNVRYYSYGVNNVFRFVDSLDADFNLISENILDADSIKNISGLKEKYYFAIGKKYETAILSKYPVLSYNEIEFPTHQAPLSGANIIDSINSNPKRSFPHITIKYDKDILNVISIRFIAGRPRSNGLKDQIKWGNYLVTKQAEEVDYFLSYLKKIKGPIIFGGDLNVPPNSKVMDKLYDVAETAGYVDNFIPAPTFRTEFPAMRLDYIFTMNGLKTSKYEKIKKVVSDHFPIYATVVLDK